MLILIMLMHIMLILIILIVLVLAVSSLIHVPARQPILQAITPERLELLILPPPTVPPDSIQPPYSSLLLLPGSYSLLMQGFTTMEYIPLFPDILQRATPQDKPLVLATNEKQYR